ncbi:GNAT family N-acetyltransferase [Paenibacillus psychroresistens]|uniref:GNAT family N-acetyltransferase n=1 Tax=Paenibacillus psychroresistens TaxID=1778678 RepID=A0A6B8RHU4_9BACL|nr:GNAT family N-acetyltransferase [Paenibacillus psychroresistens]QGQ95457.1 GNAT family N-acetyltransferase [Paenibacillus psychroresistens]
MNIIKGNRGSARLIYNDLLIEEINAVQELFETNNNMNVWAGKEYDAKYISRCFSEGDLPPNGSKENYKIQTIKSVNTDGLIGFIAIYHGFPEANIAYIAFLYIGTPFQGHGYGQEIVNSLANELSNLQYKEIRINVALKNWSALRFWSKLGFDKISGVFGDKEFAEDKRADLELIKFL